MSTNTSDIAVALYDQDTHAENAVKALQRSGFDMKNISIIGKDYQTGEHVVGFLNAGDRAKSFRQIWRVLGWFDGTAFRFGADVHSHSRPYRHSGSARRHAFRRPPRRSVVSALAGALMSIGIPKDSVLRYETALKANKFILMVHGDSQEISRAQELLKSSGMSSFEHHPAQSEAPAAAHA